MTIESPNQIQDQSVAGQTDRSPLEAERDWQHQAEVNVVERLERVGLLAPPGEMDKVMETIVNNIEVATISTSSPIFTAACFSPAHSNRSPSATPS